MALVKQCENQVAHIPQACCAYVMCAYVMCAYVMCAYVMCAYVMCAYVMCVMFHFHRQQLVALQSSRLSEEDDVISDTESSKTRPHLSPLPPHHHTPSPEPSLPLPLMTLLPRPLQARSHNRSSGSLPDLRALSPPGGGNIPLHQELLW